MAEADMQPDLEPAAAACAELRPAFERLDALIAVAARLPAGAEAPAATDPYRGLYIAPADVSRLLSRPPGAALYEAEPLPAGLPRGSRLRSLRESFDLGDFDLDLLLIALAPELDLRYERLYAFLQDDVTRRKPTVDLALNLLCRTAEAKLARRAHFDPDAPLFASGLLRLLPDPGHLHPPLLAHYLVADAQIVRYLLRQDGLDPRLAPFCRTLEARAIPADAALDAGLIEAALALAGEAHERKAALCLHFHGADGAGKSATAAQLAGRLGQPLLVAEIGRACEAGVDLAPLLPALFREARFRKALLYLNHVDVLREHGQLLLQRAVQGQLAAQPGLVVCSGRQPASRAPGAGAEVIDVPFPAADYARRHRSWSALLADEGEAIDADDLAALAGRFKLTPRRIAEVVASGRRQARWQAALGAPQRALRVDDLYRAARAQSGQDLAALARKVEAAHSWDDFVLPAAQLAQLRALCSQVRHRQQVLGDWGFDAKLVRGKGLSALFAGPSGTGKTMAAGIIAGELGLDLYRIDLSQVVNKYIGETEKNLDRVFNAAESANAILFFDEADSLFGKRSDVKDAHDRYANLEVSYLLQKMEEYEGLAILATNLRQNLDEAFLRRLSAIVEFPFPDEAQRCGIWKVLFPPRAPLDDDVDFKALAREVRLAGGHLRNIALSAAFFAAEEGSAIHQRHLLLAAQREHQKIGRNWTVSA